MEALLHSNMSSVNYNTEPCHIMGGYYNVIGRALRIRGTAPYTSQWEDRIWGALLIRGTADRNLIFVK